MWFKRTDKLFEEAARDPEQLEKLIKRYRLTRTSQLMIFYGAVLFLVVALVWYCFVLYPVIKAFLFPGAHPRSDALSLLFPVSLATLRLALGIECIVVGTAILSLIGAVISDVYLKNLLLFRASRDAGAVPAKSPE